MLQKANPNISERTIFIALLVGPITGLVVQPLVGALSDKVNVEIDKVLVFRDSIVISRIHCIKAKPKILRLAPHVDLFFHYCLVYC